MSSLSKTKHIFASFTDAPSKPKGPLETTGVTANAISLAWKPPVDDGGAKIEKYVVEKKPKGSNKWTKVPGIFKEPECTAKNLEEGEEYEFRVMAVNEHGESEPLMTTEAIKAKHPFGESPSIHSVFRTFLFFKFVQAVVEPLFHLRLKAKEATCGLGLSLNCTNE